MRECPFLDEGGRGATTHLILFKEILIKCNFLIFLCEFLYFLVMVVFVLKLVLEAMFVYKNQVSTVEYTQYQSRHLYGRIFFNQSINLVLYELFQISARATVLRNLRVKGTVSVISCDLTFYDGKARFTMVPLKTLPDHV